jgi:outer membrane biosynthesis protein TonB
MVKVQVSVAPDGSVREARVLEPIEGSDKICFAEAAMEAARSSQFRIELSAPAKHTAVITYSFVAQ